MKISYKTVSLSELESRLDTSLLTGSITSHPVTVPKEDVSVTELKVDEYFEDNGFGDISF